MEGVQLHALVDMDAPIELAPVRPAVSNSIAALAVFPFVGIRFTHARVRKFDGWLPWSRLTVTSNMPARAPAHCLVR